MELLPLDHSMKEQFTYTDSSFPIQYYVDKLWQWPDRCVPLHWHYGHEFFSAAEQDVEVRAGNEQFRLSRGESVLITGSQLHSYRQIFKDSCCRCPNIVFAEELLAPITSTIYRKYFDPLFNDPTLPYIVFSPEKEWMGEVCSCLFKVYGLLSNMTPECQKNASSADCLTEHGDGLRMECPEIDVLQNMLRIFRLIYLHRSELHHRNVSRQEQQFRIRLQKMLDYIQRHYSEKITLPELAASAGISRSEAGRCFKNYYDYSPMEYITQYRLRQAQKFLSTSAMTVNEISLQCGFRDSSYFVKVFRQHFGTTPSEYRTAQRNEYVKS